MWPKLFSLGPVHFYSYGLCMAFAFLLGLWVLIQKDYPGKIHKKYLADLLLIVLILSIVGARFFYVLAHLDYFKYHWIEIIMVHHGGLVYYGGFLGGILGAWGFIRFKKLSFLPIIDGVMVSLALGQSIGRIGCYLNGCCYGIPIERWGICFPSESLASSHFGWPHMILPTQLMASLLNLIFFIVLSLIFERKKFHGQVFAVYFFGYGILRFMTEFIRGDVGRLSLNLTMAQWLSLLSICMGFFFYNIFKKYKI